MRAIKDIYDDLVNHMIDNGYNSTSFDPYKGYADDNFIYDKDFLNFMYEALLFVCLRTLKDTTNESYAADGSYAFDTGWWGETDYQSDVIKSTIYGDYTDVFTNGAPRLYADFKQINIDENGNVYGGNFELKQKVIGTNFISTSGNANVTDPNKYNDYYELNDHSAVISGRLFDPDLYLMERADEIEAWFEAYDEVLTDVINPSYTSVNKVDYNAPLTAPLDEVRSFNTASDRYEATSTFSEATWFDEETGDSGTFVRQTGFYKKYGTGGDTTNYTVYSEEITVNVFDFDTGGYVPFTYPTSDEGVTFGDDLETIYNLAKSTWADQNSDTNLNYNLSLTTSTILGDDYTGGQYLKSGTGSVSFTSNRIVDKYETIRTYGTTSNFDVETYYTLLEQDGEETYDRPQISLETIAKNPNDIVLISAEQDQVFSYTGVQMPVYPVEGSWNLLLNNFPTYYKFTLGVQGSYKTVVIPFESQ